jgi:hypothetical protein
MSGESRRSEGPPGATGPIGLDLHLGSGVGYVAGASGAAAVVGAASASDGPSAALGGGTGTMSVPDLLVHVVEGYLLGDLQSMRTEIKPKEMGAVGYPMLMAVLAGSELLGKLTADTGNPIEHYWKTYMAPIDKRYADVAAIAKELCRNGLAHMYLTKPGVGIVRGQPTRHLAFEHGTQVILDCLVLHDHFKQSYEYHARPAIQGSLQHSQRRLNALVAHDARKSAQLLKKLPLSRFPTSRAS